MQLITGAFGFIGLHTARAFLDSGEEVVATRFRSLRVPSFLEGEVGGRLHVESLDLTAPHDVFRLVRKYPIEGIVHLVAPPLGAWSAAEEYRVNMTGLINVLEAASQAGVKRCAIASSGTVYGGLPEGPFTEEMALPLASSNSTEAFKKAFEALGRHYADRTGLDVVFLRLNGVYGPAYQSMVNLPSRLVHAAVRGVKGPLPGRGRDPRDEDSVPAGYVKDCARAIRMLQQAPRLAHRVYNIAGGRDVTAGDFLRAVRAAVPGAELALEPGRSTNDRRNAYLDITRIRAELGFEPEYDVAGAIADYVAWLRAGNER